MPANSHVLEATLQLDLGSQTSAGHSAVQNSQTATARSLMASMYLAEGLPCWPMRLHPHPCLRVLRPSGGPLKRRHNCTELQDNLHVSFLGLDVSDALLVFSRMPVPKGKTSTH